MGERVIAIRVPDETYKKIKYRHIYKGMTLKSYILSLIESDLSGEDTAASAFEELAHRYRKLTEEFEELLGCRHSLDSEKDDKK